MASRSGPIRDSAVLSARDGVPEGGSVCVFRALPGLGDMLCATPALRALRTARPDVHVALVTLPAALDVARRLRHLVDEVIPFPGFPGLPDRRPAIREIPGFLAAMQSRRFDLAVQLHGTGALTNDIVTLFGARRMAGFHPHGRPAPDPSRFLPWRHDEHEVLRWLRVADHLGWPARSRRLELPLAADADERADRLLLGAGVAAGEPLAVVHPGASTPERRWPARCFGAVADRLAAAGLRVVLTGAAGERPVVALVRSMVTDGTDVIDLAGHTDLEALGALVRRARVVVANDTGVAHVADALGTPSVVIFTASDPGRWAPLDGGRHRALTGGSPRRVADAALRLVRGTETHAA